MSKPQFIVKIDGINYPFRGFDISAGEGGLSMEIIFPPISSLITLPPLSKAEIYMQHNGKTFKLAYGYLSGYGVYKSSQDFSVGLQFVSSFDLLANLPVVLLNVAGNTTVDINQTQQYSKFFSGSLNKDKTALQAADVFNTSEEIRTVQDKLTHALTVMYNWYDNNKIKDLIDNFKKSLFTPTYASVPVELASIKQLFMLLQNMASFTTPTIGDIVNSILEATGYRLVFYPFCRGNSPANAYLIGTNNFTMPKFTSGKSPNYIPKSLVLGFNSSTSYNAPTRMLVEAQLMDLNIYMTYPLAPSGEDKKGIRPFITSYTFPQITSVAQTNDLGTAINALAQRQFFEETSKYSTASADIVFWPFVYPGRGAIIEVGDMKLWGVVSQVEHRFDVMTGPITRVTLRALTPYTSSEKWQGAGGVLTDTGITKSAVPVKVSDSDEKSTTTIETEVTDPEVVSAYMALLKLRSELDDAFDQLQNALAKYSITLTRVERQRLSLLSSISDISEMKKDKDKDVVTIYNIPVPAINLDKVISNIAPSGSIKAGNIYVSGDKKTVLSKFIEITGAAGSLIEQRSGLTKITTVKPASFTNTANKFYTIAIYHYDPSGGNNERIFFILVLDTGKALNYLLIEIDPAVDDIRNRLQTEFKQLSINLEQAVETCDEVIRMIDSIKTSLKLVQQYKTQLEESANKISDNNPNKSKAINDIKELNQQIGIITTAIDEVTSNLVTCTNGLKSFLNIHATVYNTLSKNVQKVFMTPNSLFINLTDLPNIKYEKSLILDSKPQTIQINNVSYVTYNSGTYSGLADRFVKNVNANIITKANGIINANSSNPAIALQNHALSKTAELEKSLNTYATYKKTISVTAGTTKKQSTSKPFEGTKSYNIGLTASDNGYSKLSSYEDMLSQLVTEFSKDVGEISDFELGTEPAWSTKLIITDNELQEIDFSYYRFF